MQGQKTHTNLRRICLCVIVFLLLAVCAVAAINTMGSRSQQRELELVRSSIHDALITCYAVEGAYPASLSYLREHYSITYDEQRIHVYYEAFASNIMPEIRVTMRGDGAQ